MRVARAFAVAALLLAKPARADHVLVLGEKDPIVGRIVDGTGGDYVEIARADGSTRVVPWSQIESIGIGTGRTMGPSAAADRLDLPHRVRPTIGLRFGVMSLAAPYFGPYSRLGGLVGVHAGLHLHPIVAVSLVYEWTAHDGGVRNGGGGANTGFAGAAVRLTLPGTRHHSSFLVELAFGRRWYDYSFGRDDGSGDTNSYVSRGPFTERAYLSGNEVRGGLGFSVATGTSLAIDLMLAMGIGVFDRYVDTLGCATFRFGACGGGQDFGYQTTTFTFGLRWN